MAKETHTTQLIIEWTTEYPSEERAWEILNLRVADLKAKYPNANFEPHVWTNTK